ncbi:MAG: NUDIX hydrolase [Bacilli bacterium]
MEEYFDLLDELGNELGEIKLRKEVHRDGDWHKSIHVWIINEKGDILLQRRSSNKDSSPNMLDISCTGHIAAGEDYLDAAIREIKEEVNIDINNTDLQFIATVKRTEQVTPEFIDNEYVNVYLLRTNLKIEEMEKQKEELDDLFYVSYKQFKKMVEEQNMEMLRYDEEFELLFKMLDSEFDY